jgi:hypothetical protein
MHSPDFQSWMRLLMSKDNSVLWILLLIAVCALGYWVHKRAVEAKSRAERAKRDAELAQLDDESRFMPLPAIEQAVEIADPVEIDSLLEGESEAVAARALALLTAPTSVSIEGNDDLPRYLGKAPPVPGQLPVPAETPAEAPAPAAAAPRPTPPQEDIPATIAVAMPRGFLERHGDSIPVLKDAIASDSVAAARKPGALQPMPASPAAPAASAAALPVALPLAPAAPADEPKVPVRDLVLTWYEARGYRAKAVSVRFRPIELELRHHTDPARTYAFVVARERMTSVRAATLLKMAKAAGQTRLLVAAEFGADPFEAREIRRMGVRVFDEYAIRQELDKVDLRIAAKIIAVARSRNLARLKSAGAPGPAPARAKAQASEVPAGA